MNLWEFFALACAALILGSAANAQPPPVATWNAPSDAGDKKLFAFFQPGIDATRAKTDIAECLALAEAATPFIPVPKVALIGEPASHQDSPSTAGSMFGGILPELAIGFIQEGFQSKMIRGSLRRCMFFKGYRRYALSKDGWDWAYAKGFEVERLSELATGTPPAVTALEP